MEEENKDLTVEQETELIKEMQATHKKEIDDLRAEYNAKIKAMKDEHIKQVKLILSGRVNVVEMEEKEEDKELSQLERLRNVFKIKNNKKEN